MSSFFNDPWLSLARRLIRIAHSLMVALTALVGLIALAALIAALTGYVSPYSEAGSVPYPLKNMLYFVALPLLAAYAWFLRLLRQIVDTVAAGDPFVRINADRLTRMAWITLAVVVVAALWNFVLPRIFAGLPETAFHAPSPGLLLPATLLILARVFRQGSAMREDLEGTV